MVITYSGTIDKTKMGGEADYGGPRDLAPGRPLHKSSRFGVIRDLTGADSVDTSECQQTAKT
jgi:hypothetical protein